MVSSHLPPELFSQCALTLETWKMRLWCCRYVPLLWWMRPELVVLTPQEVVVRIPFLRRNRNHLNSLYMGALVAGADLAGGLLAMNLLKEKKAKASMAFKNIQGEFLRRPQGPTLFRCPDGAKITSLVETVLTSSERHNLPVSVEAFSQEKGEKKPVLAAQFQLTLSIKKHSQRG